jgi:transcriptional regulator with XRE-family HTH domain
MPGTTGTPRARALSAALRAARVASGIGVRELARLVSVSHTQVSHWETGHRVPSVESTVMLLTALRTAPTERERITDLARNLTEANWLITGVPGIPHQLAGAIESERAATAMVEWSPMGVPGPLQTSDYARAIATACGLPTTEIEIRVMVRVGRREVFLRRYPEPVRFEALISEAVIHEPIGEPRVMADQLRYLVELAERPNITIRIVPLRIGWHPGWSGPFILYEFPDASPVVHFEHYRSGAFVPDRDDVAEYFTATAAMRELALSQDASVKVIRETAECLEEDHERTELAHVELYESQR